MAAQIRVVEEQAIAPNGHQPGGAIDAAAAKPASPAPSSAPVEPHPQVVAALQVLNARLQAVEGTVQGIPKAVTLLRALAAALGARFLVCVALIGCLGLAAANAFHPTWEGLATFGAFSVLVLLPIAALAYFRGN